jgi:CRISPR/Cas system-associated endoribonuclease Cas2
MAKYIISYDLRKPDYDYQPLYDALGELGATHIQDSVWALRSSDTAEVVSQYLWQRMHNQKDRLLVVEMEEGNWKNQNGINKLKPV